MPSGEIPLGIIILKLYSLFHQTVFIAVNIKITPATELYSCFSVALGVKLDELNSVASDISHKRDEMCLSHRVLYCDKFLIFNGLDDNSVTVVNILSLKSRQSYAATTDKCGTCGVDYISADRADIKLSEKHI